MAINMRYAVTRLGGMGVEEVIVDNCRSGDEAADKAYKPGCKIIGVHPAQLDEPAGLKSERRSFASKVAADTAERDAA
jgi:hypothetical protein